MKIYFAGSIRGGRKDVKLYTKIIEYLKKYGVVLTEHVGNKNIKFLGEDNIKDKDIHNRDFKWILESDTLVAEVSTASLGVGYEIGRAIENGKRVLCLYRSQDGKRISAMISGSPNIIYKEYQTIEDAKKIIDELFK